MRKEDRYRLSMFRRVVDFGAGKTALFPESSEGSEAFKAVGTAVAAIEEHLKKRDLVKAEAVGLKKETREAVVAYLKVIATTARQVTKGEAVPSPFVMPAANPTAILARAAVFIDEAREREASFVRFGMSPTFVAEFTALVQQFQAAVEVQNNARGHLKEAQAGIRQALVQGMKAVRILDVSVANAVRRDAVQLGYWRGARRADRIPSPAQHMAKDAGAPTTAPVPTSDDVKRAS